MAGRDWLLSFMKRHNLSLRTPEATSASREIGFNKIVVQEFFEFLASCIDEYKFSPEKIFNVLETGLTVIPKLQSKIIAQKGRKQVSVGS